MRLIYLYKVASETTLPRLCELISPVVVHTSAMSLHYDQPGAEEQSLELEHLRRYCWSSSSSSPLELTVV
jgi:hypothetical protein